LRVGESENHKLDFRIDVIVGGLPAVILTESAVEYRNWESVGADEDCK
jgi:hypothetical protein